MSPGVMYAYRNIISFPFRLSHLLIENGKQIASVQR